MASPDVAGTPATNNISTATDPWPVNLPSSIQAGETLLMFLRGNNANSELAGGVAPSGWNILVADEDTDASTGVTHILWRKADGGEGATQSVDLVSTAKGAAICVRISGAADPTVTPPQVSTVAVGTDANPDPGSVSVSGGPKDVLALAWAGMDGEGTTYTEPGDYTEVAEANSGTGGLPTTNVCVALAKRLLSAVSSVDPGTFTASASPAAGSTAFTVVVHPAAGADKTIVSPAALALGVAPASAVDTRPRANVTVR